MIGWFPVGRQVWPRGSIIYRQRDLLKAAQMLTRESSRAARMAGQQALGHQNADQEAAAILWTMAQRLAVRWDAGNKDLRTYTEMIAGRAPNFPGYSQPIAWQWADPRDEPRSWCRPGGPRVGSDGCNPTRLARRHATVNMTWTDIEHEFPGLQKFVTDWAKGKVPNPVPKAVGFAAWSQRGGNLVNPQPTAVGQSHPGNFFEFDSRSARWPDNYVRIEPFLRTTWLWWLAGGATLLVVGGIGWMLLGKGGS